jgi:hypothetical protein
VFLQEACVRLSHDLQQALERERWLYGRVAILEHECKRLQQEHAELCATVEELTQAAVHGGGAPAAAGCEPVSPFVVVPPMAPITPPAPTLPTAAAPTPTLRMVPPPANRMRSAMPRQTAPQRMPRMSRRWSCHTDWDALPDEEDLELAQQVGGVWYMRPAALVFFAAAAALALYAFVL